MTHRTTPTDHAFLPYGRQLIGKDDINEVVTALSSAWLTTGPAVPAFERELASFVGAQHAVAVSSGTAALHTAMASLDIGPGDEVIVPAMTFAATANAVVYQGGTPVFADVETDTLLVDPQTVEALLTPRTKAIVAVDYGGQPCDYNALRSIADRHGLALVADACHSLGAEFNDRKVGTLADCTVFSFHPVKHITTGEGGMVVTEDSSVAERMRRFRNHGIATDHRQREALGTWQYAMVELGYNYRITDLQCALGSSQLTKLPAFLERRRRIAALYTQAFAKSPAIRPLTMRADRLSAWHLYVVRIRSNANRESIFQGLRKRGIGVNVHYLPVYQHPYYRQHFGLRPGLCPVAEAAYEDILSLPIWPGMDDDQVERVVRDIQELV